MKTPAYSVAGEGERLLLCLHGIGGDRHAFNELIAAPPAGWRAAAWDMPGYGDSDPLEEMTWQSLSDAAIAVLDDLDADRAVLLGHSMGGMVAQEVALRFPDRVTGLILFATVAAFGGTDDTFKNKFLAARLAPLEDGKTPADFAEDVVGGMFNEATPAPVREVAVASMAAVPSAAYRQALNCIVTFDRKDDLGAIECPTLLLAAERDALSPPRTMEKMAGRIPNAGYRCLPEIGHLANFEDPAAFKAAVEEFLDTLN